jgi:hypothetical protein
LPMAVSNSRLGISPASDDGVAFTKTMTRMFVSFRCAAD